LFTFLAFDFKWSLVTSAASVERGLAAFLRRVRPGRINERVVNGGFEDGFKAWRCAGNVHVETNNALEGKASAIIGPGAGSLTQRIETGSGNDFTVSAFVQSERPDGCSFVLRFLDEKGEK